MVKILSKKINEIELFDIENKEYVYIGIDDYIKIGVVENSRITMKVETKIFKKSSLISNYEKTLFDTKLEDLYKHYKTILENYEFNAHKLLYSNYLNDYVARKIVSKTVNRIVDILNEKFNNYDVLVFDVTNLKYQDKLIKLINENFKTRKLYFL